MSGIYGFEAKVRKLNDRYLNSLNTWNRYYGGVNSDEILYENLGMGCHRDHLSDSINCSVPIIFKERFIAVIDAVLYNREELFPILAEDIDVFISDEELLFLLIQKKGYSVLSQVNGDFSGAIYDKSEKEWILFRDHLGIRPLYYYLDEKVFAFSTDMRGLIAIPGIDLSINEEKLYLKLGGYNDLSLCETEFQKIRCIMPASWTIVKIRNDSFELYENIYWKLGQTKIHKESDEEYQFELRRLITDSVKRRLDAVTGLVGCELSGGLDSSVIAILISRLGREGKFYSWSESPLDLPMREGEDERKIIQDICKQEQIECAYTKNDKLKTVNETFEKIDPPYINTRYISKGAEYLKEQGAKVVFTGHGGDEGVSHRCNEFELWYHREYKDFIRLFYQSTKKQNLRILRTLKRILFQIFVINPHFKKPFEKRYSNTISLLNKEFVERISKHVYLPPLYFAYNPIGYIMQGGSRVRLDNIAVQGAENGIRYMVPYLDYRVIDYAVSIPRAQYKNEVTNRYIFRKAFDDIMPQSLRDMHYKDAPSQRDYKPTQDLYKQFLEMKEQLLAHLNKEDWEKYLNFDRIENISVEKDAAFDDYVKAFGLLEELMICGAIQNVRDKAGKWSEEHE